ncbi:MAG: hypothetical protein MI810_20915 [Flavobacteriales bacterium]|jgi:DNA-binding NtrC family response regulator|nr:hypothetical protein [Flavobacteriales bacterium]
MIKIGREGISEYNLEELIWKKRQKQTSVFVMDESSLFGALVKTNVESGLDCAVSLFESGQELFDSMVFDFPDVIILDFRIGFSAEPGHLTSWDIYQQIQDSADLVPLIAVTSETDERFVDQLKDLNVVAMVNKNDHDFFDQLIGTISTTLEEIKK